MSEELQEVISTNPEWYRDLQYEDVKGFIQDNINNTCRSFVAIGYYLKYIRDNQMYVNDGYESIWELAQTEFGISKSQASKFMAINDKFSKDGNSQVLMDTYKDFSSSKLSEMLYLTDEQLEQVTVGTTVAQIREIRKPEEVVSTSKQEEILSALGKPKRIYPEGSLLSTPGCEGGSCFSCSRDCQIREEDRYCVEAPMGNPFYCDTMYIDDGLLSGKCMFINLDLAYHRAGDHEPSPCCKECKNQCEYACKRAVKEQKPVVTEDDFIIGFYRHMYDSEKQLVKQKNAELLRVKLIDNHGKRYENTNCILDGWTICYPDKVVFRQDNQSTQIQLSWGKVASRILKLVDDGRIIIKLEVIKQAEAVTENVNTEPEYIETVNEAEKIVDKEPEIVNDVDEPGQEPDVEEEFLKCSHNSQFTCSESAIKVAATRDDVNCNGVCCWDCSEDCKDRCNPSIKSADQVETVEADIVRMVPENNRFKGVDIGMIDTAGDPIHEGDILLHNGEKYHVHWYQRAARFVAEAVERKYRHADMEEWPMYRINECAVLYSVYGDKPEQVSQVIEETEPAQPELPILKNNDQRAAFINAYATWPIWIDQKETGERYYRYNLTDKVAMVVKVSLRHIYESYKETKKIDFDSEQYYLLGIKSDYSVKSGSIFREDPERTFYECSSNKSALVDYLKELQKKGASQ